MFTLKNAGIKTTHLGLFGNPALGKYWTEHMQGYFDRAGLVQCFLPNMLGCFIKKYIFIYQLLFKNYHIADLKWTGNKKTTTQNY